jgi:N-acetyl sugar amidotransferase
MKYCTRCLYPANHPLGLTFDEQGVCSGCRVHEEKDQLDWRERWERLRKLVEPYRCKTRTVHDCIIPVSGARDSYFIVHVVRNLLGLNPLLVTYNKHYNTDLGIRNLAYLQTLFGCDILKLTVSPDRVKRVTRESLHRMGSMYWHCLAGHTVWPVQTAVRFKIPLIIWGAHQGNDQVGMFSHLDEVEMTRKYRKEHDLMGFESEDLAKGASFLKPGDVEPFAYPNDRELATVGVRGIYLNNYVRWDSKAQHEKMIREFGYETGPQQRTFDTYNDVDCFHYSDLHDAIKFYKWGYGKVTDHACRELRLKRLTREQGIDLVERYGRQPPKSMAQFARWLGVDEQEMLECVDRFRDSRVWSRDEKNAWRLMDSVAGHRGDLGVVDARLGVLEPCDFTITPSRRPGVADDGYVLIGRGHVDDAPECRATNK